MKNINWIKTLYYNYHFFGSKGLLKLPLIIHNKVVFGDTSGKIIHKGDLKRGTIRFGSPRPLATRDMSYERTIIDLTGVMVTSDNVHIAPGSRISINKGATLNLGRNFNTSGNCTIICDKNISIGDSCLFSWDIQIMDADFHKIFNESNELINPSEPIEIGDNVWICSRVSIYKGSKIPNGCIVAGCSVVTRQFTEENSIIGGVGRNCTVIKSCVRWQR